MELGTFLQDVELMNITFLDGVLSVAECNDRGFNIEELRFPNGSKSIALTVPFTDRAVLNKVCFSLYCKGTHVAYLMMIDVVICEIMPLQLFLYFK